MMWARLLHKIEVNGDEVNTGELVCIGKRDGKLVEIVTLAGPRWIPAEWIVEVDRP